jgi:predicted PurR-regulated permease PerM
MSTPSVQWISFIVLVVIVSVAFIWLLLPFYGAVLWAVILALLFNPLQRWLERKMNGRRGLAAAVSLLACICIVVIPGSLILASLAREATSFYGRLSSEEFDLAAILETLRSSLPTFLVDALASFDAGSFQELQAQLTSFLGTATQAVASRALIVGQGTAQFLISLGVMLYVLFFLFRDGPQISAAIRRASPLNALHTNYILGKFTAVLKATVKGNVIIAIIQGLIGGLTFFFLGIEGAMLWGVVMAILSLLPAVGSFLVWAPVATYLLLSGQYWQGGILLFVGVFVISLIDNLLRPPLVGKGTRMPDYVVLVSTLGGIALFGLNGFVIGPLIAALFIAVWSLLADDKLHASADTRVSVSTQPADR